jgi:ribosomal protein S18 acetylase RimI-like enzyme
MKNVQVALYVDNEEVKVDIPLDLYQQVCNEYESDETRHQFSLDFENIVKRRYPSLHHHIMAFLRYRKGITDHYWFANYKLASDWFEAKEEEYTINIDTYRRNHSKWNKEIAALGEQTLSYMPSIESIHDMIEGKLGSYGLFHVMTADDNFAGFAVTCYIHSVVSDPDSYQMLFIPYFAVSPKYQRKGLGSRLLHHVTRLYENPVMLISTDRNEIPERSLFAKTNGFFKMPAGIYDCNGNSHDIYMKGEMNMGAWVAAIEKAGSMF